uniref:Chromatin modification-related protein MEAF6 n=1 Tax=Physcomitrium patens TaxID=3218 RepID=A9T7H3_PHYPA
MSGQRVTSKPHQTLNLLNVRQDQLLEELRTVEKQLYDLETTYLHDSSQCGNVLKGFEGFLSSIKGSGNLKRPRKFQPEDRLFSLSSVTSPVVIYSNSSVIRSVAF